MDKTYVKVYMRAEALLQPLLVIAFLLALMPPASLLAQERATIVGTVTDSTGAVVPNVKVTVTNDATGVTRILVTNSSGNYSCAAAPYWAILGARRVPGL